MLGFRVYVVRGSGFQGSGVRVRRLGSSCFRVSRVEQQPEELWWTSGTPTLGPSWLQVYISVILKPSKD